MAAQKISIEADVGDLNQKLSEAERKIKSVNDALKGGTYKVDIEQALKDYRELLAIIDKVNVAQDKLYNKGKLEASQAKRSADVFSQAAETLGGKKVDGVRGSQGGFQNETNINTTSDVFNANDSAKWSREREQEIKENWHSNQANETRRKRREDQQKHNELDNKQAREHYQQQFNDEKKRRAEKEQRARSDSARENPRYNFTGGYRDYSEALYNPSYDSSSQDAVNRRTKNSRAAHAQQIREQEARDAQAAIDKAASEKRNSQMAQMAGTIAGAAIGGGGLNASLGSTLGGFAGKGIGAALAPFTGGMSAIIAPMIGSALGGKIGGAADAGLSETEKESVSYSQLRHMVGAASIDFDKLRDSTRGLTEGFGVTYNETVELAKQFAHTAAISPLDDAASNIGKSLRDAVGLAQGYGVDSHATTQFLATQSMYGVTNNETDNKKLALQIGEAVGKSGTGAKYDEVLGVISNFTQMSANQSLMTPDVSSYTSLLGTLMGSNYAGLSKNPQVAGNVIGSLDQGFRGANSDIQKNYIEGAFKRFNPVYDATDLQAIQESGVFGTAKNTFGKDSAIYQRALANGDTKQLTHLQALAENGGTDTPNLKVMMDDILNVTKNADGSTDTKKAIRYVKNLFGTSSETVAGAALDAYQNEKGFDYGAKLKEYGIDEKTVKTSQIPSLMAVMGGGDDGINKQYKALQDSGFIKPEQKSKMDAMLNDNKMEEFKKEVIKLTLANDSDEGQVLKNATVSMDSNIQKLVDGLIPAVIMVKEGITALVKLFDISGKNTFVANQELSKRSDEAGIELSGKDRAGNKSTDEQLLNSRNSLELTEKAINLKGITKEAQRDQYTNELAKARINPDSYIAEMPSLLNAMAKNHNLLSSDEYKKDGKEFKVDYAGKSVDGNAISSKGMAWADENIAKLMGTGNRSKEYAAEVLAKVKEDFANNPEAPANFKTDFLDKFEAAGNDANKMYVAPKPKVKSESPSYKSLNDNSTDATIGNHVPISKRGVVEKIAAEAMRQGNTPEEAAKIAALAEQESSLNPNIKGPVISKGTHKGDRPIGIFQMMAKTAKGAGVDRFNVDENIGWGIGNINDFTKKLEASGLSHEEAFNKGLASNLTGQARKEYYEKGRYPTVSDQNGTSAKSYVDYVNRNDDKYLPITKSVMGNQEPEKIPEQQRREMYEAQQKNSSMMFNHNVNVGVTVSDTNGNPMENMKPSPVVISPKSSTHRT